jgi:hypothetical protein
MWSRTACRASRRRECGPASRPARRAVGGGAERCDGSVVHQRVRPQPPRPGDDCADGEQPADGRHRVHRQNPPNASGNLGLVDGGGDSQVLPGHADALEHARAVVRAGGRGGGRRPPAARGIRSVVPARITSPASRRAVATDSTTTVVISSAGSSRASGSCEPTATTVACGRMSPASNRGVRAVVAQQTMSASATAAGSSFRPSMVTSTTSRTASMAATWPCACGPLPNTTSRAGPFGARWSTASADTAGVRSVVSAGPSSSASGASVAASIST